MSPADLYRVLLDARAELTRGNAIRERAEAFARRVKWGGRAIDMLAAFAAAEVAAEREACAEVCEAMVTHETPDPIATPSAFAAVEAAQYCADRIRARTEKEGAL